MRNVDYSTVGELVIPVDESLPDDEKPAWLVDGQQRSAAIRDADLAEFPVAAVGFIAHGEAEQRSQFILVNNTRPLPKGLIHELLPDTMGHLPAAYARKQLPAYIMSRLNQRPAWQAHPSQGRIATPTQPDGYIKDNSVLKMIENSLYDGALYQYRDPKTGRATSNRSCSPQRVLDGCAAYFPDAWALPPRSHALPTASGFSPWATSWII